jgi:hypothetical protein
VKGNAVKDQQGSSKPTVINCKGKAPSAFRSPQVKFLLLLQPRGAEAKNLISRDGRTTTEGAHINPNKELT